MRVSKRHLASAAVLVAVVAASGCVTKKVFRRNVEETNSRFQSVEGSVEENERRTADLGKETDQKIATVPFQPQTSETPFSVTDSSAPASHSGGIYYKVRAVDTAGNVADSISVKPV